MLFHENEKYYKLVIKTTKNKNENFVKSFHLLKEKDIINIRNKKDNSDCVDLAFPLSPVGSVARFTVSELSIYIINYISSFSTPCPSST